MLVLSICCFYLSLVFHPLTSPSEQNVCRADLIFFAVLKQEFSVVHDITPRPNPSCPSPQLCGLHKARTKKAQKVVRPSSCHRMIPSTWPVSGTLQYCIFPVELYDAISLLVSSSQRPTVISPDEIFSRCGCHF